MYVFSMTYVIYIYICMANGILLTIWPTVVGGTRWKFQPIYAAKSVNGSDTSLTLGIVTLKVTVAHITWNQSGLESVKHIHFLLLIQMQNRPHPLVVMWGYSFSINRADSRPHAEVSLTWWTNARGLVRRSSTSRSVETGNTNIMLVKQCQKPSILKPSIFWFVPHTKIVSNFLGW